MKDFFKYVGATVVGIIIVSVIAGVISFIGMAGMMAAASSSPEVQKNSVLVIQLSGDMQELSSSDMFADMMGQETPSSFSATLKAIKAAKDSKKIKGIYIEAGAMSADMAQLEEIRDALEDFKKSGKWIVAYGDSYTQGAYYVASVADKVYLNPQGMLEWYGIGGQMPFVKGTLTKLGVKVVPFKCGKYKSATEMFTEDKMSGPSREQTERYISGYWSTICQAVSKSRGVSVDSLNAYADRLYVFADQKDLVKAKLVDNLLYADQVRAEVKKRLGIDEDDDIHQASVDDMAAIAQEDDKGDEIAVYYAFGDIYQEVSQQQQMQGAHYIVGTDVCRDLQYLADDDDVKAVVLRVNSGGGDAYASEQIWRAVQQLRKKKPVVVSMGGAAASGGYYISCGADYIFAEPTTLTGSIGIFGLTADLSGLLTDKLGVSFDAVGTNRNSTMGIMGVQPMTPEQAQIFQAYIDRGYITFKTRVSQGRKLSMDEVEQRAQGHVLLGSDAMKLKLVDELGGLDKAVAKAAQLAKLGSWHTADYPAQPTMLEQLMAGTQSSGSYLDGQMRTALGDLYEPTMMMLNLKNMDAIQARIPFYIKVR